MALADYDDETMRRDTEWQVYRDMDRDDIIERELSEQHLRRAQAYESGWYVSTSVGKVWATDTAESDNGFNAAS
jgi:hypothetical protein